MRPSPPPLRSTRMSARLVPTTAPSGHGFPESSLSMGSSCVMPATAITANMWFGGHSSGSATAPLQSGGWLPGWPGPVVVVVDDVVVVVGGVLVVVLLEVVVVVGGWVVVEVEVVVVCFLGVVVV